jgi:hypothetical protein
VAILDIGVLCPLVPYYTPKIGPMTLDCILTGFLSPLWFGSVVSFMDMCSGLLLIESLLQFHLEWCGAQGELDSHMQCLVYKEFGY